MILYIIKLYYVTCYQYLYEVLLIRVATSTLNPGTKWFGIGKWDRNGTNQKIFKFRWWHEGLQSPSPHLKCCQLSRARGAAVFTAKHWKMTPPLSHRGNGKSRSPLAGGGMKLCDSGAQRGDMNQQMQMTDSGFNSWREARKHTNSVLQIHHHEKGTDWQIYRIYRIYHTKIRLFATALLKKQSNAMSSGFPPILCQITETKITSGGAWSWENTGECKSFDGQYFQPTNQQMECLLRESLHNTFILSPPQEPAHPLFQHIKRMALRDVMAADELIDFVQACHTQPWS